MAENEERKRKLTSNSIGLPENHLVSVKVSNSMMVLTNMRGNGFKPASNWFRTCRILESQLPEGEMSRN